MRLILKEVDRIIWEEELKDFPLKNLLGRYNQHFYSIKNFCELKRTTKRANLSEKDLEDIFYRNAEKLPCNRMNVF